MDYHEDDAEEMETMEAVEVFRRQMKRVLGADVKRKQIGRKKKLFYYVTISPHVIDLMNRSDFMQPDNEKMESAEDLESAWSLDNTFLGFDAIEATA